MIIYTVMYITDDSIVSVLCNKALKSRFYMYLKKGPYSGTSYAQYLSYFLRLNFCGGDLYEQQNFATKKNPAEKSRYTDSKNVLSIKVRIRGVKAVVCCNISKETISFTGI